MLLLWLLATAPAQPCPDLPSQIERAWFAFDDAELEGAKAIIAAANDTLACQATVVPTHDLLELYRLDGLVSLAQEDPKGATYATIRAVAADHEGGAPPERYGPELAEIYQTWADRLGATLITIRVDGGGAVHVDGRRADALHPIQVAEGAHLIQVEVPDEVRSEVVELSANYIVETGIPGPAMPDLVEIAVPEPAPLAPVVPAPQPVVSSGRKHPLGLLISGGVSALLGGAALATAVRSERSFLGSDYGAPSYQGCEKAQPCYAAARGEVIDGDVQLIRIAYLSGYGLTGVGVGLLGVGAVGLPTRTQGASLAWRFRW